MIEKKEFSPQSFAVIGAGAVGCIVAAFLAKMKYKVTLCDVVPELIAPAVSRGIIIEGTETLEQKVTRTVETVDDLADDVPDVIFICVKANATPLIASAIEPFVKQGAYAISWQNGIDTELELSKILGKERVMRAVVNFGCGLKGPCHVIMPFHHPPHYIQELDPKSRPAAEAVSRALSEPGLQTERTDDIVSMVWRKSIMNASMNPVCAVTGLTMAKAMNDPLVFELIDALTIECTRVARVNEISLGWDYYPYAMEYLRSAGDHKPSMLMDILNNRRTEVDYMNGKMITYGHQAGIPTPYNHMIRGLVKAIEPS
ncbi:MAG: 2-dehydropantoate 2-reductase [Desulfobacteraceae bacterium]|jgi:2-dehydropantoate 2-reductase